MRKVIPWEIYQNDRKVHNLWECVQSHQHMLKLINLFQITDISIILFPRNTGYAYACIVATGEVNERCQPKSVLVRKNKSSNFEIECSEHGTRYI